MTAETIYCSQCGQACAGTARYCHVCGSSLVHVEVKAESESDPLSWIKAVYKHLRSKQPTEAESIARAELAKDSNNAIAYALLGSALMAQYQVADSYEVFQKAIMLDPGNFIVSREYALYLAHLGRYAEASEEATRAMQKAPTRQDFENTRDLQRIMSQKSQGSFVRQSYLPSFGWLSRPRNS
ncbi:MAG TPA: hypothetical protein VMT73_13720 [Anaerolineales bacterium]|nr:hypothetical protein [Anaerolineales bacterium]